MIATQRGKQKPVGILSPVVSILCTTSQKTLWFHQTTKNIALIGGFDTIIALGKIDRFFETHSYVPSVSVYFIFIL